MRSQKISLYYLEDGFTVTLSLWYNQYIARSLLGSKRARQDPQSPPSSSGTLRKQVNMADQMVSTIIILLVVVSITLLSWALLTVLSDVARWWTSNTTEQKESTVDPLKDGILPQLKSLIEGHTVAEEASTLPLKQRKPLDSMVLGQYTGRSPVDKNDWYKGPVYTDGYFDIEGEWVSFID